MTSPTTSFLHKLTLWLHKHIKTDAIARIQFRSFDKLLYRAVYCFFINITSEPINSILAWKRLAMKLKVLRL